MKKNGTTGTLKNTARKVLYYIISITILILYINLTGSYGIWGLIIGLLLFSGWRCWRMREHIVAYMRYIETMIWGKPLEKEYWKKGELKKKKVKIVWKRKPKESEDNEED